jgi:choline dehydrogenase
MAGGHDLIVVGVGLAGSIVAARASADPARSVLALEAGPEFPAKTFANATAWVPTLAGALWGGDLDWRFDTTPQSALGGRTVAWPRGKVIGGSTGINVQAWVRGHPCDYDAWESFAPGWNWGRALDVFRTIEDADGDSVPWYGRGGPLPVARSGRTGSAFQVAVADALADLGLTFTDVNGPQLEGFDFGSRTTRRGLRVSFAEAFLTPVRHRPNLSVLSGAHVLGLEREGTRITGVRYLVDGRVERAHADEVVLAGGAVATPQLLLLSGIGPAAELSALGIDPVVDLPGVGRGLHDHPAVWTGHHAADEAGDDGPSIDDAVRRVFDHGDGPLAQSPGTLAFVRSDDSLELPDIELIITPSVVLGDGRRVPGVGVNWVLLDPHSRGTVTLRSADPLDAPAIDPAYLSDPAGEDLAALVRGHRIAAAIAAAPSLARFAGRPVDSRLSRDASDDDVRAFIYETVTTIYHPVGTARLGAPDDDGGVLDASLRVRGIDGLRVADASAIPRIVRGHTAAATAVIAWRAADVIDAEHAVGAPSAAVLERN